MRGWAEFVRVMLVMMALALFGGIIRNVLEMDGVNSYSLGVFMGFAVMSVVWDIMRERR